VETKPLEQEVTADASAMGQSIAGTGKVAVYGIYFDTNKSEIKPESKPTLDEITKLLKQKPQLKIYAVGHTDDAGTLEANIKLSADRAATLVARARHQFVALKTGRSRAIMPVGVEQDRCGQGEEQESRVGRKKLRPIPSS
jgi:OOP family OmpA-OmpF porin